MRLPMSKRHCSGGKGAGGLGGGGGVAQERPALTSPRQSYNLLIVWEPPLLLSFNRFVWGESRCLLLMCPIAQVAYRI